MAKIKAFIYLDNYKMYSISSQIFEGLTEYIISSSDKKYTKSDQQKGHKIFDGQLLADIIEQSKNETEKKFLNDYAFTLFEQKIREENKVLDINGENVEETIHQIDDSSFVAVKGRIVFNDSRLVEHMAKNFNDLGFHVGMLTGYQSIKEDIDKLTEQVSKLKDRNQKAKKEAYIKQKLDIKKLLKLEGLQLNAHFLNGVEYIVNYGYDGQFQVQTPIVTASDYFLFSSTINRGMLKESESTLIKKYSRETEKEFVVFGIPTQTLTIKEKIKTYAEALGEDYEPSFKEALINVINTLTGLENTFTGKHHYEYIIDPIAIYREI